MTAALLSMGSNIGDSRQYLLDAVTSLGDAVHTVSSLYRTAPWGPVAQDDFLNIAVLVADPVVDAYGWWQCAQTLEKDAVRTREIRWGPRTLDVDIVSVWHDATTGSGAEPVLSADTELTLPHPRAHERGFVLVPWHEIDPDAVVPGHGAVSALLHDLDITDVQRVGSLVV